MKSPIARTDKLYFRSFRKAGQVEWETHDPCVMSMSMEGINNVAKAEKFLHVTPTPGYCHLILVLRRLWHCQYRLDRPKFCSHRKQVVQFCLDKNEMLTSFLLPRRSNHRTRQRANKRPVIPRLVYTILSRRSGRQNVYSQNNSDAKANGWAHDFDVARVLVT